MLASPSKSHLEHSSEYQLMHGREDGDPGRSRPEDRSEEQLALTRREKAPRPHLPNQRSGYLTGACPVLRDASLSFRSLVSPKDPCVRGSIPSLALLGEGGNFKRWGLLSLQVMGVEEGTLKGDSGTPVSSSSLIFLVLDVRCADWFHHVLPATRCHLYPGPKQRDQPTMD